MQFEENYNALLEGFEVLDFLGDAFIPRVDFKLVLQEFGIRCQAIDLENFLAKYVTSSASPPTQFERGRLL